jgi:hypothetical protein
MAQLPFKNVSFIFITPKEKFDCTEHFRQPSGKYGAFLSAAAGFFFVPSPPEENENHKSEQKATRCRY